MRNNSTEQNRPQAECIALGELTFGGAREETDKCVEWISTEKIISTVKGTVRLSWAILNGVIGEGLTEVTFEWADVWGRAFQTGVVRVQALGGSGCSNRQRSVSVAGPSVGRGRAGPLLGHRSDLDFSPGEMRSLSGL